MTTLAEQLGFGPGDRVAIVHADDIGMSHAANRGAFAALERGPATCGSVMVPCPGFEAAAEHARGATDLDLGVHLTLNAEFESHRWGPAAPASDVPSLLDTDGCLPRTSAEVAEHAKPDEVALELRVQIERALEAGIDVTHLDGHMGTVFFPPFVHIYAELAQAFRLPVMVARPDEAILEATGLGGAKPIFDDLAARFETAGFPVLTSLDIDSLAFDPGAGSTHNARRLDRLPVGVSYLICHPAHGDDELRAITPESAHQRDFERCYYGGEEGRSALAQRGIHTVGMRPLRDLLRGEA
ncbi:MAG: polysaccharide deacetylase family protein [Planctomycetota bacterium]|jgi:hypothetical protein|nr:hypothetical protein [Deltaproteobacteria bacterium]MDP6540353.1 polysaccharide deacetylase family protein [Planctomycetota bacterium]